MKTAYIFLVWILKKIEKHNCITHELLALYGINYCFLNVIYCIFFAKVFLMPTVKKFHLRFKNYVVHCWCLKIYWKLYPYLNFSTEMENLICSRKKVDILDFPPVSSKFFMLLCEMNKIMLNVIFWGRIAEDARKAMETC